MRPYPYVTVRDQSDILRLLALNFVLCTHAATLSSTYSQILCALMLGPCLMRRSELNGWKCCAQIHQKTFRLKIIIILRNFTITLLAIGPLLWMVAMGTSLCQMTRWIRLFVADIVHFGLGKQQKYWANNLRPISTSCLVSVHTETHCALTIFTGDNGPMTCKMMCQSTQDKKATTICVSRRLSF